MSAQERPGATGTCQASRRSLGITARGVERKIQSASLGSCTGNGGGKTSTGQDRREEGGGREQTRDRHERCALDAALAQGQCALEAARAGGGR